MFAHTSPVYVSVGGREMVRDPETTAYMRAMIEGSLAQVRQAVAAGSGVIAGHHHHEGDHEAFLARRFEEALEILSGP